MDYFKSKKAGDIGEEEILIRINKKYANAYIDNTGKANSDWDIYIPEINEGVESKMDYKSKETGNIVIEVEMNGKPSALSVTKSKYWVFVTGYELIWITPLEIYRFIEQHPEYGRVPFTGDGDNKEKKAYLVRLHTLKKYVNNLPKTMGWIEKISENNVLYYNNFIEYLQKINNEHD